MLKLIPEKKNIGKDEKVIDFNPLLKAFREHLEIRNRAKLTIKHHLWHLGKFIEYMDQFNLDDIRQIRKTHLEKYRKYRYYRKNKNDSRDSVSTQNRHLASLKCFFAVLRREGYILDDPTVTLAYAKEPRRLPKSALVDKEVQKLLDCPDTGTVLGFRDRTIMEVLYSTGIRRSELINLNLEDVDYKGGYLRINEGKGGRDRVVPIGKIACEYLENYIKGIRSMFHRSDSQPALFISKKGHRLSKNTLHDITAKYAKMAGVKKQVTCHTFRRSCATEMIKNQANAVHIKDLLGHTSLRMISVYCDLSIVDLKKAHKKYHPRESEHHSS